MPRGEMPTGLHELLAVNATGALAEYRCRCGQVGRSTRAFPGEDLRAKAERAWRTHASRARKREREAREDEA